VFGEERAREIRDADFVVVPTSTSAAPLRASTSGGESRRRSRPVRFARRWPRGRARIRRGSAAIAAAQLFTTSDASAPVAARSKSARRRSANFVRPFEVVTRGSRIPSLRRESRRAPRRVRHATEIGMQQDAVPLSTRADSGRLVRETLHRRHDDRFITAPSSPDEKCSALLVEHATTWAFDGHAPRTGTNRRCAFVENAVDGRAGRS